MNFLLGFCLGISFAFLIKAIDRLISMNSHSAFLEADYDCYGVGWEDWEDWKAKHQENQNNEKYAESEERKV